MPSNLPLLYDKEGILVAEKGRILGNTEMPQSFFANYCRGGEGSHVDFFGHSLLGIPANSILIGWTWDNNSTPVPCYACNHDSS